jgi:hypothetical protein
MMRAMPGRRRALLALIAALSCAQESGDYENPDFYEYACDCVCVCVNHTLNDECVIEVDNWSCEGACSTPSCGTVCGLSCDEIFLEDGGTYVCGGPETVTGTCEPV